MWGESPEREEANELIDPLRKQLWDQGLVTDLTEFSLSYSIINSDPTATNKETLKMEDKEVKHKFRKTREWSVSY